MVKLGFIVEGDTEKILLESVNFRSLLDDLKLSYITDVINVCGNGNLLPHNIKEHTAILQEKGATHVLILTDLDNDKCVTETKSRINPLNNHICVVSKKKIEAWFLADTKALKNCIQANIVAFDEPEEIDDPFKEISNLKYQKSGRGINNKRRLANLMVEGGFSFSRAAEHPKCISAKYFVNKLRTLSEK